MKRLTKKNKQESSKRKSSKLEESRKIIDISTLSVAKSTLVVIAIFAAAYLLYSITHILILLFVSFFIAAALDPMVDKMEAKKIPRTITVLLIYVLAFVLFLLMIAHFIPLLAEQVNSIASMTNALIIDISKNDVSNYPEYFRPFLTEIYNAINTQLLADQLKASLDILYQQVLNLSGNIWSVLMFLFNGLMNVLIVVVLVFFMTVDEKALSKFTLSLFPANYGDYVTGKLHLIRKHIGYWIRGQLMVSVFAFLVTFVFLAPFGVKYSLTISILAGIMMIIPVFGRVFAWIVTLPIVFNQSPAIALYLTVLYLAISQIENNFIVPLLMKRAVGLNPILIILALLIGYHFLGILGLILAIPIATIVAIFVNDISLRWNGIKDAA